MKCKLDCNNEQYILEKYENGSLESLYCLNHYMKKNGKFD